MNEQQIGQKYPELRARGMTLSDSGYEAIVACIQQGCLDMLNYLHYKMEITLIFTQSGGTIGFIPEKSDFEHDKMVLNIPVPFLNKFTDEFALGSNVDLTSMVNEMDLTPVPLRAFLEAAGSEEVIHFFQYKGVEGYTKILPDEVTIYKQLPDKYQHLCNFEIEASDFVDRIRTAVGKMPVSQMKNSNKKNTYPDLFGKPCSEIYRLVQGAEINTQPESV